MTRAVAVGPGATSYLVAVQVAGGVGVVALVAALLTVTPTWWAALGAVAFGVACLLMQVRPMILIWKGERLAIHADEGLLLVAFVLLPLPLVVLAAGAATIVGQVWKRKSPTKVVFNSAAQLLATWAGAFAFAAGLRAGLGPFVAALLVPFAVSSVNQVIVGILLAKLADERWPVAFRAPFLSSIAIATATGTALGVITLALLELHVAALVLVLPAWIILHRGMAWAYHRENELEGRRVLNGVARSLLGRSDEATIVEDVTGALRAVFAPVACGFLRTGASFPPERAGALAQPIRDAGGATLGELWVVFAPGGPAPTAREEEMLRLLASYLSLALVNARATASLERSERRMRDAFNAAADPILVVDRDLSVVFENEASRRFPGGSMLSAALAPASRAALAASLGDSSPQAPLEMIVQPPQGGRIVLEASTSTLVLPEGGSAFLVMTRDVTEERRLRAEAEAQRDALARAERLSALGTLVEGVAHEVNNPLMYLHTSLDFAKSDLDEAISALEAQGVTLPDVDLAATRDQLATARAGADRIAEITRALDLIVSAPAGGSRPRALDAMLREAEAEVRPRMPEGVRLELPSWPEGGAPLVPGGLQRVLVVLLTNAAEALHEGGSAVKVACLVEESHVTFSVEDDGPGIPAEVRSKLFTPFFTTKLDRTGIGLATAMSIVRGVGGSLDVVPREGRGARFDVRVPRGAPVAPVDGDGVKPVGMHAQGMSFSLGRRRPK